MMLNPYIKAGQKPKTPKAMMRFAWEEEDIPGANVTAEMCHPTEAEVAAVRDIFKELLAKQ